MADACRIRPYPQPSGHPHFLLDRTAGILYRNLTIKPLFNRHPAMSDSQETIDTTRMCKALGHPARLAILRQLLVENRCICGRIVEVLPLAQSTVSQHLKVLKESGLIRGEIEGPATCYCADRERLAGLAGFLAALAAGDETER